MTILDEFGHAEWRQKNNTHILAIRQYDWCDRILIIDESVSRKVIDDVKFSTFDFSNWIPVSVQEFNSRLLTHHK